MRKRCFFLAALLILSSVFSTTAFAAYLPPVEPSCPGVYMENMDTGRVMYEKAADQKVEPGYLAKVMTAIVVLDTVKDLDQESTALKLYIQDMVYGARPLGGILYNEEVTIRGLLYAMLLQSANEATLMLGDYVGDGSLGHFTDLMNQKAAALGCTNTTFADPAGFHDPDPAQCSWSTPRDMAIIFQYAMANTTFKEMIQTRSKDIGPTNKHKSLVLYNYTNAMMSPGENYYYPPTDGGFYSAPAGMDGNLVSLASVDGYSYLLVLMGVPGGEAVKSSLYTQAIDLYKWAFQHFSVRSVVEKGQILEEVPVKYSFSTDHMPLETSETFMALMPEDIDLSSIQYRYDIPPFIPAPVEKGTRVGTLHLLLADEEIGSVPLVTTDSVSASKFLSSLGWFENAIHTFWMKFVIIFVLSLVVLYIALLVQVNRRKRRRGRYSRYKTGKEQSTTHYL